MTDKSKWDHDDDEEIVPRSRVKKEVLPKKPKTFVEKITDGYKVGMSDVEVCRELDITMKTFNEMYETNEGFQKLVNHGRMLSNAWWMEQGRKNLWNRDFSVTLWNFNMKNRFGWADKSEVTAQGDGDKMLNLDDLRSKLHKALPKIIKTYGPELADSKLLEQIKAPKDEASE